jgi:hypothetical protein
MKNRFKFSRVKSGGIILGIIKKKIHIADFIVSIETDSKYIYIGLMLKKRYFV